jgi:hypothetical protein
MSPPLLHVAAGIPAAFPKPFNVVPPDKNISPSVKIAAVGGGKAHSSDPEEKLPRGAGTAPSAYNELVLPDDGLGVKLPSLLPVPKSATSVQLLPSQDSVTELTELLGFCPA